MFTPFAYWLGVFDHALDPKSLRRTKLIKPQIPFTPIRWLWNDKVAFINTRSDASITVIEDAEIAKLMTNMFESMWENEPEAK
jgi:hypothetical protein